MRLWTLQPLSVYESLMETGIYRSNPSLSKCLTFGGFQNAYDWLIEQMIKKIGPAPIGVKYPVWAWYKTYWKHKRPDLRRKEFRTYKESMLCLEIEKSNNEVVLTDEENWYFVLNNSYIADNEDDFDKFDTLSAEIQKIKKVDSWQKIFDIEPFENAWSRKGMFVQATFWELKMEEVQKVIKYGK